MADPSIWGWDAIKWPMESYYPCCVKGGSRCTAHWPAQVKLHWRGGSMRYALAQRGQEAEGRPRREGPEAAVRITPFAGRCEHQHVAL